MLDITLENQAMQELQRECGKPGCYCSLEGVRSVCPAVWLVPDLLRLMEEHHRQPVSELAGIIRQRLLDAQFQDGDGDTCVDPLARHEVERQLAMIVRALERVRQEALQHGLWDHRDQPTHEAWFG